MQRAEEAMADRNVEEQGCSSKRCSYCQQPPLAGTNLKRCSRCHKAWYHGAECQRNHFRAHKKVCRTSALSYCVTGTKTRGQRFSIRERTGRGKCLVATSAFKKGGRLTCIGNDEDQNNRNNDGWQPLVPPVLHEKYRETRCALCFQTLFSDSPIFQLDKIPSNPIYKLLFCSSKCRHEAAMYGLDREERAALSLYQRVGPPILLSTAILLYRILLHHKDSKVQNQIQELQYHVRREEAELPLEETVEDEASQFHAQGVIVAVMGMLQCSNESVYNGPLPSLEYLKDMIRRIKINGFSICDGEFVTYGVGLFSTPSFMNHSCYPNAVQTFVFQKGSLPSLFVTAFDDIQPGEEVTISYTDTSCPRHVRQQRLATDYSFHCCCKACQDILLDSTLVGMKCADCTSSSVVCVEELSGPSFGHPTYRCSSCGRTDFESTLEILQKFERHLRFGGKQQSRGELRDTYDRLKRVCNVDSWYVQEAGECLLQASLDFLGEQRDNPTREQRAAGEALGIAEELLVRRQSPSSIVRCAKPSISAYSSCSAFLKRMQLRYKAAKLRLFTVPDPRQSIQELQDVLRSLSLFYPREHELIVGLEACLMNALL